MTDELAGLMASIIAAPDDDTPRLVYADWLEDRRRPATAAYVRASLALGARVPVERWQRCTRDKRRDPRHKARRCRWCAFTARSDADVLPPLFRALQAWRLAWRDAAPYPHGAHPVWTRPRHRFELRYWPAAGEYALRFRRGLPYRLTCRLAQFLGEGEPGLYTLCRDWPVETVTLSDIDPQLVRGHVYALSERGGLLDGGGPAAVPPVLFERLSAGTPVTTDRGRRRGYATAAQANKDLSHACLRLARGRRK